MATGFEINGRDITDLYAGAELSSVSGDGYQVISGEKYNTIFNSGFRYYKYDSSYHHTITEAQADIYDFNNYFGGVNAARGLPSIFKSSFAFNGHNCKTITADTILNIEELTKNSGIVGFVMVGAGGGGGGCSTGCVGGYNYSAQGGGGGAVVYGYLQTKNLPDSYKISIKIGQGGDGGVSDSENTKSGNAGGSTYIQITNGTTSQTLVEAPGGGGGAVAWIEYKIASSATYYHTASNNGVVFNSSTMNKPFNGVYYTSVFGSVSGDNGNSGNTKTNVYVTNTNEWNPNISIKVPENAYFLNASGFRHFYSGDELYYFTSGAQLDPITTQAQWIGAQFKYGLLSGYGGCSGLGKGGSSYGIGTDTLIKAAGYGGGGAGDSCDGAAGTQGSGGKKGGNGVVFLYY